MREEEEKRGGGEGKGEGKKGISKETSERSGAQLREEERRGEGMHGEEEIMER